MPLPRPMGLVGEEGVDAGLGQGLLGLVHHVHAHDGDDLFHAAASSAAAAVSSTPELMV